jgi:hypothetical protein
MLRHTNHIALADVTVPYAHRFHQLWQLVYDELRRLAGAQMAREMPGQTLDATALVHEAYLRLAGDHSFGCGSTGSSGRYWLASGAGVHRLPAQPQRRQPPLRLG